MKEIIDSPKINFRNLHDITNNWAMALKNFKKITNKQISISHTKDWITFLFSP